MHINQTKQNYIYITVCVWMWYWTVCSPAPGQQQKWESAAACCDGAAVWPQGSSASYPTLSLQISPRTWAADAEIG